MGLVSRRKSSRVRHLSECESLPPLLFFFLSSVFYGGILIRHFGIIFENYGENDGKNSFVYLFDLVSLCDTKSACLNGKSEEK